MSRLDRLYENGGEKNIFCSEAEEIILVLFLLRKVCLRMLTTDENVSPPEGEMNLRTKSSLRFRKTLIIIPEQQPCRFYLGANIFK